MKRLILSAALALTAVGAAADTKPFEGVVTFQVSRSGSDKAQDMQIAMSGGKWRIDGQGPRGGMGAVIIDPKAHSSIILMTEHKMFMRRTYNPKAKAGGAKATIVKTGKTDTIAGYKVEDWQVTGANGKTADLWATKDLGRMNFAFDGGPQGQGAGIDIPDEIKKGGFFPLRIESDKGKLEATKVVPGAQDPSLFTVPADYKEMDMGGMPGMDAGASSPAAGGGMAGMTDAQKQEMQEKMQNMTPEQKAMMEKMMQGQGAAAAGGN